MLTYFYVIFNFTFNWYTCLSNINVFLKKDFLSSITVYKIIIFLEKYLRILEIVKNIRKRNLSMLTITFIFLDYILKN